MRPPRRVTLVAMVLLLTGCRAKGPVKAGEVSRVVSRLSGSASSRAAAEERLSHSDPSLTWGPLAALFAPAHPAPAAARAAALRIFVRTATFDLPDVVVQAAVDPDPEVRHEALGVLRSWGDPQKARGLDLALARVTDPAVKAEISAARERLVQDRHGWEVRRLAVAPDSSERLDAARTLADVGRPEDLSPLEDAFQKENVDAIRASIVLAVASIATRNSVAPPAGWVRERLGDPNPYVRAAAALGELALKDPQAVPSLQGMLSDDPVGDNRLNALNALLAIGGEPAREAIGSGCKSAPSVFVKTACATALKPPAGSRRTGSPR